MRSRHGEHDSQPGRRNRVGEVRRSQLVGTYGPGAVIDFRSPNTGAPVSGLLAGLEEWEAASPRKGLSHRQVIKEPRLQRRCGVQGFRLPPVRLDDDKDNSYDILPVVRFPDWLQCSRCGRLARSWAWQSDPGDASRHCPECSRTNEPVFAAPVRFVVACGDGHIDEFPWQLWIGCSCKPRDAQLVLDTDGPGLGGKFLSCKTDGCASEPRSFDGVFSKDALSDRGLKCRGRQLWLPGGDKDQPCNKKPRVLQRGASNLYWGLNPSAIDIPPFSNGTPSEFGEHWESAQALSGDVLKGAIAQWGLVEKTGQPIDVLLGIIDRWRTALDAAENDEAPLQWEEYQQFVRAEHEDIDEKNFKVRPEQVTPDLRQCFDSIVLASRLREVRVTTGFTRITPPSGPFSAGDEVARIYVQKPDWLPGVELLGEGIFLRFNRKRLEAWESKPYVKSRIKVLQARIGKNLFDNEEEPEHVTARFVLIHSFAHALMLQLSLECGYSSSALKERLYVGSDAHDMCGVLIHTGSPDSEGTLGGLVRQGRASSLAALVRKAGEQMEWCSSDPVCITDAMTISSPRNGAACHSCLLTPETSCEHFNRYLDRALLVGTPDEPRLGFFRDLLDDE